VLNVDAVSSHLVTAYRRLQEAMLEGDTSALQALLSQDFILVHMTGYAQPRSEWLQHIESGKMRYFSSTEDSVSVTVKGHTAKLRGRNKVRADIWGAQGTWSLQLDIDFQFRDDRWLMTHARASAY